MVTPVTVVVPLTLQMQSVLCEWWVMLTREKKGLLSSRGGESRRSNDGESGELHVEMRGWNDCSSVWLRGRGNECRFEFGNQVLGL